MGQKRQVVVVTGASAGVGRAVVRQFARRGACIGLLARGRDGLAGAAQDVQRLGGQALTVPTDVAHFDQVEAAAAAVENRFGPIDVWVNNAMVTVFSPFIKMTADEFQRVVNVTLMGVVHGTMAALRRMLPRDHGIIIQSGSALAYRGIPLQSAYCSSKHGIQGFTESVRCELLHEGSRVRITMVQFPALNTPQFRWVRSKLPNKAQPVPPIYQPEVAARAIVWSADQYHREVLVGGSTVAVIWGNKFFPGLGDRYLAARGYESQQTDEPEDPNRPDNLWQPVAGDHGAHGVFDDRAKSHSKQLWLRMHRGTVLTALGLGAVALLAGAWLPKYTKRRQQFQPKTQRHEWQRSTLQRVG